MNQTERTRFGGVRRTEVAQSGSASPGVGEGRSVRILPSVQVAMRERLGLESCPYVIRWRIETPWWSIRLHHWLAPDDARAKHDHPWSFVTFVLKGGYIDRNPEGDEYLRAPTVRYREATHQHTVVPDKGGVWTIIVTGPKIRRWGFWDNGKFIKANKWFASRGHHPCD